MILTVEYTFQIAKNAKSPNRATDQREALGDAPSLRIQASDGISTSVCLKTEEAIPE